MRVYTDLDQLPAFHNAVVTIGSFDGVHTGHRRILEKVQALARTYGGESVVITFDPHPRTVLQPNDTTFKLLTTTTEKILLLEQCEVDHVVVVQFSPEFAQQSAKQYVADFLVQKFHPRCIVIGYDHRFGNNREGDINFLKRQQTEAGFEVVEIPAQEVDEIAVSSSKIRKALDQADVAYANRLLEHPFSFSGTVVAGSQVGRTIGFPTANIEIADPYKLILPAGIYAARVSSPALAGLKDAMLYIGQRPTLEVAGKQVIEVNILDFDGDLYGQSLRVEVLDFIRPDKKLDGLESLKRQIEADKTAIRKKLEALATVLVSSGEAIRPVQPAVQVAVVILNYNTRRHLAEYLPSVVANSAGARIVVADNGSPDDSVAFLREHYPAIEVVDLQKNHGFAQGYNEALRQVQADVYVILNSDVQVTPGWMEPVLDAMRHDPTMAIAQPKILAWSHKHRFEYAGAAGGWIDYLGYPFCRGRIFSYSEADHGQYDRAQQCFWAAGAAFFIRAELYHSFGGFDGDYFAHNEEIDLCWRLKRAGYSVWCIPQSVVYHLGGGTLEYENPRKVLLNFRNSLYTLLKNESFGKLLWLLPARFLLDGLAGLRFAVKGQFAAIGAIVRAHLSFYGTFQRTLAKRRLAAATIAKYSIGPNNQAGLYPGSIIVAHYLRRKKSFAAVVQAVESIAEGDIKKDIDG